MLITENALTPRRNRERLAEFFFETVQAPLLYVALPPVLALYSSGRTTGLAVDVGDTVTTAVPIVEGHCDAHAIRRMELGGRDVTDRLVTLLRKEGHSLFGSSSERQVVRRIKERIGYVAEKPREEEHAFVKGGEKGVEFKLPDGEVVTVGAERFRAAEILMRPELIAREFGGVQECVKDAIEAVDLEVRKRLYGSIVLAGGGSKMKGFGARLLEEVRGVAPRDNRVRIHAPKDRLLSAYNGGSVLASLSTTFREMAVTRSEYFDNGASILHRKTM